MVANLGEKKELGGLYKHMWGEVYTRSPRTSRTSTACGIGVFKLCHVAARYYYLCPMSTDTRRTSVFRLDRPADICVRTWQLRRIFGILHSGYASLLRIRRSSSMALGITTSFDFPSQE